MKYYPKVDLHRHLEGSLRFETVRELAREHSLDLPQTGKLRKLVQVQENEPMTFENFLSKFANLRLIYRSPEIITRITQEVIEDAAADNIRYMELRFTPIALSRAQGFPLPDVMDWVASEIIYVSDSIHYPADEYWQSPAQTYLWRTGDCEDYAILALYLIHRDVGIDGMMWVSHTHGWVYVDGHEWEPQLGVICDGWYEVVKMLPYEEVIRRATTSHKRLDIP